MESDIDCEPSDILKVFDKKETLAIEKQWMSIYCKNKQGHNTKDYKWHIFSGGGYPSKEGEKAHAEYDSRLATEYIIMSDDHKLAVLTGSKPEICNLTDYYVFPTNMAWVMAFTHEEGWLGPYFAVHPKFEYLNKENEKSHEKQRKIEIAKQKGWC